MKLYTAILAIISAATLVVTGLHFLNIWIIILGVAQSVAAGIVLGIYLET